MCFPRYKIRPVDGTNANVSRISSVVILRIKRGRSVKKTISLIAYYFSRQVLIGT